MHNRMQAAGSKFAVATFVTDLDEYASMQKSFCNAGFSDQNTVFHAADNSLTNHSEPYSGIESFWRASKCDYLIIVHQDVRIMDTYEQLVEKLMNLTLVDHTWAVAGNAGFKGLLGFAARISDPTLGKNYAKGAFPQKVDSLDENLLILNAKYQLCPNRHVTGFHFYGADLCIQARARSLSSYVIDWHVQHLSSGKRSKAYYDVLNDLELSYRKSPFRIVRTTCDILFLGSAFRLRGLRNFLRRALVYVTKT